MPPYYSLYFGFLAYLMKVASHFLDVDIEFLVLDLTFSWVSVLTLIFSESAVIPLFQEQLYLLQDFPIFLSILRYSTNKQTNKQTNRNPLKEQVLPDL